jgi:hypothetical protein
MLFSIQYVNFSIAKFFKITFIIFLISFKSYGQLKISDYEYYKFPELTSNGIIIQKEYSNFLIKENTLYFLKFNQDSETEESLPIKLVIVSNFNVSEYSEVSNFQLFAKDSTVLDLISLYNSKINFSIIQNRLVLGSYNKLFIFDLIDGRYVLSKIIDNNKILCDEFVTVAVDNTIWCAGKVQPRMGIKGGIQISQVEFDNGKVIFDTFIENPYSVFFYYDKNYNYCTISDGYIHIAFPNTGAIFNFHIKSKTINILYDDYLEVSNDLINPLELLYKYGRSQKLMDTIDILSNSIGRVISFSSDGESMVFLTQNLLQKERFNFFLILNNRKFEIEIDDPKILSILLTNKFYYREKSKKIFCFSAYANKNYFQDNITQQDITDILSGKSLSVLGLYVFQL